MDRQLDGYPAKARDQSILAYYLVMTLPPEWQQEAGELLPNSHIHCVGGLTLTGLSAFGIYYIIRRARKGAPTSKQD